MPRRLVSTLALIVAFCSVRLLLPAAAQHAQPSEEQTLKSCGLPTDTPTLLEWLRRHNLGAPEPSALKQLVAQLGAATFKERETAQRELLLYGIAAVPLLKQVDKTAPLELLRRAELCLKNIDAAAKPEVGVAVARTLAQRHVTDAIPALFHFLTREQTASLATGGKGPVDPWLESEVLACLADLAFSRSKIHPLFWDALKDPSPARRGYALYLLGRRGDLEHRLLVRKSLGAGDDAVAVSAAQGLVGKHAWQTLRDSRLADEDFVRSWKVATDESALNLFLQKRTLSEQDQVQIKTWIRQLGDVSFKLRHAASRRIVEKGPPALLFLKEAENHADLEIARRVHQCIDEIRRGPGPALSAAVVRLLARPPVKDHDTATAVRTLLQFVPFADDEWVEEEALTSLCLLSVQRTEIDPLLAAALTDPFPARRGAAAYVLGKVGTQDFVAPLRKLLTDPEARVRFRAAQGLLAARDAAAVPTLIALLQHAPQPLLWQTEEVLQRLAGEQAPSDMVGDGAAATRTRVAQAWTSWWAAHASSFDWARVGEGEFHRGLMLVCEYDSAVGRPGGQVWEATRDGTPRWRITGLLGAMDAQILPNGRVLIAENSAQKVTERDLTGAVRWQFQVQGNPIACQRLPSGNTFIATYHMVMEVTPSNQVVYAHNKGPGFYLFSARKLRNGVILCMTAQGVILEIDSATGKELRTIPSGTQGGWCSVEALPGGRYLVATMANGQVREIDATGKSYWQVTLPGAFRAIRLPNGNTLVASMTTRKLVEFDRTGNQRWDHLCEGRPWGLRYR